MKNLFFGLILCFSLEVLPQDQYYLYTSADELPRFGDTDDALYEYIYQHLEWPKSFDGEDKILVSFIVTKEGKTKDIIIEKALCNKCGESVKKVLVEMPLWKPGKKDGERVDIKMYLPVDFIIK